MKFYNRKEEIKQINKLIKMSQQSGRLVVLQGRRRIGKTVLALHILQRQKFLYFFVGRKTEKELLEDFEQEIRQKLSPFLLGRMENFSQLLEFLFSYAQNNHLVVVFDEFQNFRLVNPSFFSELQKFWDLNKNKSKIAIFCLGSMFTLIKKIFTSSKEPLYGRADRIITLEPFTLSTQAEILKDLRLLTPKNFLMFYALFGGVPKYFELLADNNLAGASQKQIIRNLFCQDNAYLLKEGKHILVEEFGKSYDKYFSILTAIALGRTTKNEIYNYTGININSLGAFLNSLENFYEIIERKTPITERKSNSKLSLYKIKDNFLAFWFRYIYKKNYLIEIKNWPVLLDYIIKDLDTYLGFVFEDLIKDYLIETNNQPESIFNFEQIGGFWRRPTKTSQSREIDIVAINHQEKQILIGECKLQANRINQRTINELVEKSNLLPKYKKYQKIYWLFAVDEPSSRIKKIIAENNFKFISLSQIIKTI